MLLKCKGGCVIFAAERRAEICKRLNSAVEYAQLVNLEKAIDDFQNNLFHDRSGAVEKGGERLDELKTEECE